MNELDASRREYARRMHRVLAHIEKHLSEALPLPELAAVAHFSAFHFHRLFTAWVGETLGTYLRRRRLEVAALRLLTQPQTSVLDIALLVGFGSGEAFARAFKERFDCTPSAWRRQQADERKRQIRNLDQAQRKIDQDGAGIAAHDGDSDPQPFEELPMKSASVPLNVSVIQREPVRVAYLRHVGAYGAAVHTFWQEHFWPFVSRNNLVGRPVYGISHDDPTITAPEKCRYDVAVTLGADEPVPSPAQTTTIEGGRYASVPFVGTSDTIGAVWNALLRDWLPQSGWQLDGRPCFEHYPPDASYDEAAGTFSCDIVVPLKPLNER
jgi:AraC family transcriptional regulator